MLIPANNQTVKISLQTGLLPSSFPLEAHILLGWLRDAGVSHLIADEPLRPLQTASKQSLSRLAPQPSAAAAPRTPAASVAATNWAETLNTLTSLEDFRNWASAFRDLSLCRTATQAVLGIGQAITPRIMVIAEAPDATEDQTGKPYSGAALGLLHQALNHLPVPSDQIYLTYLSKWRPPGQRSLSVPELDVALAMLQREITLVEPRHVIALGDPVFKAVSRLATSATPLAAEGDSGQGASLNPRRSAPGYKLYDIVFAGKNDVSRLLSLQKPELMLKDDLTKKRIWQGLLSFCRSFPTS